MTSILKQLQNKLFNFEWPIQVVQTIPAQSPGPWTGSASIGQEQNFAPDKNNKQTILKMYEWGAPEIWSISLGATYSDNRWPAVAGNLGVRATIELGVGGATQSFDVDWNDGVVLSGVMNAVSITATYRAINPGLPIKAPSDLRLSAMVSRGTRGAIRAPTFTGDFTIIPIGGPFPLNTPLVRIPRFATEIIPLQVSTGGVSTLYDAANQLILYESSNPTQTGGIQIAEIPLDNLKPGTTPLKLPGSARYYNFLIGGGGGGATSFPGIILPLFTLGL